MTNTEVLTLIGDQTVTIAKQRARIQALEQAMTALRARLLELQTPTAPELSDGANE